MGTKSKQNSGEVMIDYQYDLYDDGAYQRSATLNKWEADTLNYAFALNGTKKKWKKADDADKEVVNVKYPR